MAYAEAKHIDKNTIPVIDLSPLSKGEDGERFVGRQLLDIVQRLGFFYVENHGVPQAKIDLALETGAQFFRLDRAKKETVRVADYHRGFLPIGEATMSGASKPDNKESFIWGWDVDPADPDIEASNRILAPNRWPDVLPELVMPSTIISKRLMAWAYPYCALSLPGWICPTIISSSISTNP